MGEQWHDAFYPLFVQTHPDDYLPGACLGCLVPVAGTVEALAEPGSHSSQGCSMFAEQLGRTARLLSFIFCLHRVDLLSLGSLWAPLYTK